VKSFLVAFCEVLKNRFSPSRVIDFHETPGLAIADRWRKTTQFDQLGDLAGNGRGKEMPNVTPPSEKFFQCLAEGCIELWAHNLIIERQRPELNILA
jgi:hypothetical protein